MAPDTVFFPFLLHVRHPRCQRRLECASLKGISMLRFTGITFAFLRRFRELAWIRGGLLCLALSGGRSQATQEGRTRESSHGF
jgi:hypothetical protein